MLSRVTCVCVVLLSAGVARADRYVGVNVTNSGAAPEGTFYIGTQTVGNPGIETLFVASFDGEETSSHLRNQMMPAEGIPGVGKRANAPAWSTLSFAGIQIGHPDNVQFWASLDEADWQAIPANGTVGFQLNGPTHTTTVTFRDVGTNGWISTGNVPAVSTWGLIILGILVLTAGTVLVSRRRVAA